MIFGLHEKPEIVQSVRERLCEGGLRSGSCNNTMIRALMRVAPHHINGTHTMRIRMPDQTEDAVIYVAVVVVFYAAIIILLVGTNIRRPQRSDTNPRRVREFFRKQTVLVFEKDHTKTIKTSHKSLHALPAEGDVTITPL